MRTRLVRSKLASEANLFPDPPRPEDRLKSARTSPPVAYGGVAWEPQAAFLEAGVELLVATPGRLAFLMGRGGEAAAGVARTIAACGALKQLANATVAFKDFLAKEGSV